MKRIEVILGRVWVRLGRIAIKQAGSLAVCLRMASRDGYGKMGSSGVYTSLRE